MNRRINLWLEDIRTQVTGLVTEWQRMGANAAVDTLVVETAKRLTKSLNLDEDEALEFVFEHVDVPGADSTAEDLEAWLSGAVDGRTLEGVILSQAQARAIAQRA